MKLPINFGEVPKQVIDKLPLPVEVNLFKKPGDVDMPIGNGTIIRENGVTVLDVAENRFGKDLVKQWETFKGKIEAAVEGVADRDEKGVITSFAVTGVSITIKSSLKATPNKK